MKIEHPKYYWKRASESAEVTREMALLTVSMFHPQTDRSQWHLDHKSIQGGVGRSWQNKFKHPCLLWIFKSAEFYMRPGLLSVRHWHYFSNHKYKCRSDPQIHERVTRTMASPGAVFQALTYDLPGPCKGHDNSLLAYCCHLGKYKMVFTKIPVSEHRTIP